jgi:pyridoxine 5'-phosphate synthase PdxJ
LSPGSQIAQTAHSIAQFLLEHPEKSKEWNNNYLVCLSAENEKSLKKLLEKLESFGIPISMFYEPDLDNQLTSITFQHNSESRKYTTSLPLALK